MSSSIRRAIYICSNTTADIWTTASILKTHIIVWGNDRSWFWTRPLVSNKWTLTNWNSAVSNSWNANLKSFSISRATRGFNNTATDFWATSSIIQACFINGANSWLHRNYWFHRDRWFSVICWHWLILIRISISCHCMRWIHWFCCWMEVFILEIIMCLKHLSLIVLKSYTNLKIVFLSLIKWSHVVHNVVFFHQRGTDLPNIFQSKFGLEHWYVTKFIGSWVIRDKLTFDKEFVFWYWQGHRSNIVKHFDWETFIFVFNGVACLLEIANIMLLRTKDIWIVLFHQLAEGGPIIIWQENKWKMSADF